MVKIGVSAINGHVVARIPILSVKQYALAIRENPFIFSDGIIVSR